MKVCFVLPHIETECEVTRQMGVSERARARARTHAHAHTHTQQQATVNSGYEAQHQGLRLRQITNGVHHEAVLKTLLRRYLLQNVTRFYPANVNVFSITH
jgi:hypothetical protein